MDLVIRKAQFTAGEGGISVALWLGMVRKGFLLLFFLVSLPAFAQERILEVQLYPNQTDERISQVQGPHRVYFGSEEGQRGLLVTLSATDRDPQIFRPLSRAAVELSYDVISLDYPNTISTPTCKASLNPFCFDQFRAAISNGNAQSSLIDLDKANTIEHRLKAALKALSSTDSRWEEYLAGDLIKWNKLTLLGHSQGAGHAAFLSKHHEVNKVVMLGGPQDHFEGHYDHIAPWIKGPGRTPTERYFALLHRQDFFNRNLNQVKAFHSLGGKGPHMILSDKPVVDGHMDLVKESFRNEWMELLRR